jgi:hypothetical protein
MDWEHDHYQNPTNANRRPTKAFYLDVLQNGMESYSHDEVAECISAYHTADEDISPQITPVEESQDLQSIGGSNWFSDNSSWSYTKYDSEMEYVAQYYHFAQGEHPKSGQATMTLSHLGEEERVERDGSRMVLPPRDLSEASRR